MVTNTARRVREGLAELIRLVNDPATSTSDLRALLGECKAFGGQLTVLQADAAAGLALRERHGDGGVGVLAQAVGLSRRDAAGQVKTAKQLEDLPSVRDAVESGDISVANARVLAGACERTSAEQVEHDSDPSLSLWGWFGGGGWSLTWGFGSGEGVTTPSCRGDGC